MQVYFVVILEGGRELIHKGKNTTNIPITSLGVIGIILEIIIRHYKESMKRWEVRKRNESHKKRTRYIKHSC